jgi:hypothetical protein
VSNGLERVARALCELDGHPPGATMDGKPLWQDYLPEAWAAVMALREPDTAMMRAAASKGADTDDDDAAAIYRAMIDAAMSG